MQKARGQHEQRSAVGCSRWSLRIIILSAQDVEKSMNAINHEKVQLLHNCLPYYASYQISV